MYLLTGLWKLYDEEAGKEDTEEQKDKVHSNTCDLLCQPDRAVFHDFIKIGMFRRLIIKNKKAQIGKEKSMKKIISLLLALVMLMSLGLAFAQTAPAKEGLGPNMLLLPTMENMGDKFPNCWDNYGLIGRMMLFSRLLRLNADLVPVYGDLAKEWTASEDGMHYTFTLNDNVKWHDGVDLTADDVVFSMEYALKTASLNAVMRGAMRSIKGVEEYLTDANSKPGDAIEGIKVDNNLISIEMAKPSGTFLLSMAQFNILPRHLLEKIDPLSFATSEFFDAPIGSGPYYVKEFKPNDYALLEAFPEYFGKKPQIELVKMTQMTQADYPARALADEIDFFHINDLATAEAAAQNPNYEMFFVDIYFVRYFMWNSNGAVGQTPDLFKDIRTRRAFMHAIDRQAIADGLMPGQAALTNTKVPAAFDYYNKDAYNLDYNPEKAIQLLKDANFDFSKTVKLAAYYADQTTANFMDAVCSYLSEVGIKAEWKLMTGNITAQLYETKDYDFVYAGLSAMTVEEAYNPFHNATLKSGVMSNVLPTDQTDMDALIEELWKTSDTQARKELLLEMQIVESEKMLWFLPMFSLKNLQVVNTARVNLPEELVFSNEWSNYERYLDEWTLNPAK